VLARLANVRLARVLLGFDLLLCLAVQRRLLLVRLKQRAMVNKAMTYFSARFGSGRSARLPVVRGAAFCEPEPLAPVLENLIGL
jgi:hypothetical protein